MKLHVTLISAWRKLRGAGAGALLVLLLLLLVVVDDDADDDDADGSCRRPFKSPSSIP